MAEKVELPYKGWRWDMEKREAKHVHKSGDCKGTGVKRRDRETRRRQITVRFLAAAGGCMLLTAAVFWGIGGRPSAAEPHSAETAVSSLPGGQEDPAGAGVPQPAITQLFLTPNEFSRPQKKLEQVNGIVIHYTANPGTTARNNRDYFEMLKDGSGASVSSHFVIGLEGEIIQCIPLDEVAYASNHRNSDTISVECCHMDESGAFQEVTYQSLVQLTAWLCGRYGLGREDIIRHYDVTGKECPKYFVDHTDAWEAFRDAVAQELEKSA